MPLIVVLTATALLALAVGLAGAGAFAAPASAAAGAYVRVDQAGYPSAAPKRAYVLAGADEGPGAAFDVLDAGGTSVLHGALGPSRGAWNAGFPDVYPIDFAAVRGPGTFHIHVTGAAPADSPPFAVDAPGALYTVPLADALQFFQAQRDGPNTIPGVLGRGPSHTALAQAFLYAPPYDAQGHVIFDNPPAPSRIPGTGTIDLSGGWLDAGDHLKFADNEAFATFVMLDAIRRYPSALRTGPVNLEAETRFGLDWLLKAWDDTSRTLYFFVGLPSQSQPSATGVRYTGDHDVFRTPESDDTTAAAGGGALTPSDTSDPSYFLKYFPVLRAGPPGARLDPKFAGRFAAAFGLCAQVFRGSDPALADRCLLAGQHVFELADPAAPSLCVGFCESEYADALELGATELALATAASPATPGLVHTDPGYYLSDPAHGALHWGDGQSSTFDPLSLANISALADVELISALRALGGDSPAVEAHLLTEVKAQLDTGIGFADGTSDGSLAPDPFALGVNYDNNAAPALPGLAATAELYDDLTGGSTYASFAQRQLDYLFGANAWGESFEVGVGTTFPHCVHSTVANLEGSLDGGTKVLAGAIPGGPNDAEDHADTQALATGGDPGSLAGMRRCSVDESAFGRPAQGGKKSGYYFDDIRTYSSNEPDIGYTPLLFLALADRIPGAGDPLPVTPGSPGPPGPVPGPTVLVIRPRPPASTAVSAAALRQILVRGIAALSARGSAARRLRAGRLVLAFAAPEAGTVSVALYGPPPRGRRDGARPLLAGGRATVRRHGRATVRLALTRAGRRALRGHGVVRLDVLAAFAPARGAPVTLRRALALRG